MAITTPTAYWKLEDLTDEIGSLDFTNNGTTTFSTGKVSNAAYFNGSSQYLSRADTAVLRSGDRDWSLSFWFYAADIVGTEYIISKRGGSTNEWGVRIATADIDLVYDGSLVAQWSAAVSATTWYHVVAWHDATANEFGIVLNAGTPVTGADTAIAAAGTSDFVVGGITGGATLFGGRVDEVGWWADHVLTSGERSELYNGGSGQSYPFPSGSRRQTSLVRNSIVVPRIAVVGGRS